MELGLLLTSQGVYRWYKRVSLSLMIVVVVNVMYVFCF